MAYRDAFVRANGVNLHYLDWGGDEQPLLLLHPTGFHAHVWDPFVRRLRDRYHCLALDRRGHGDSGKPGSYTWVDFADDLQAFMQQLDLRQAIGIGHSAGGTAISVVAARDPEAFARAVLLDPVFFFGTDWNPNSPNNPMSKAVSRRRAVWPSRQAMYDSYAPRPPFKFWEPEFLRLYVDYGVNDRPDGTVELKCSPHDEAMMYRFGPTPMMAENHLPNVRCPALLISGDRSDALPPEKAERVAALIPTCEWLVFNDTSHFVPFERPGETFAAISHFLDLTVMNWETQP
jgi:pimeloyl-ACP methyl ester carboxylesterase